MDIMKNITHISPYKSERELVRNKVVNYIEVHVNTPLEVCEARDPKGMYAKARRGEIKLFTGVDDPYEVPENPHLRVCGDEEAEIDKIINEILSCLKENQCIS